LRNQVAGRKIRIPIPSASNLPIGGAERNRTVDLLLAKQALSQLSYSPFGRAQEPGFRNTSPLLSPDTWHLSWWAREDLNLRPHAYQARALTN
jgi:hypothetical protein